MAEVTVKVTEIIDDTGYPMIIQCKLKDCNGTEHFFIDKVPVICQCDRYPSELPCLKEDCTGAIRCRIIGETDQTYLIDTEYPDDVQSLDGAYQFEVRKEQVK